MTREDVKYWADCLKNNKKIDSNTMEEFCNEVIKSQNKLQNIENLINDAYMSREETYNWIEMEMRND